MPVTVPTGIPLGYTPPSPEDSTSVPAGTESRYGTPRNSSAPSPLVSSDGATTPLALPVTVKALTRNSGCAQVITTLLRSAVLSTTPINPSGATTGSNSATPFRVPTSRSRVRPSVAWAWCSTSAATYGVWSRRLSARSWRSRSFSAMSDGRPWAR